MNLLINKNNPPYHIMEILQKMISFPFRKMGILCALNGGPKFDFPYTSGIFIKTLDNREAEMSLHTLVLCESINI